MTQDVLPIGAPEIAGGEGEPPRPVAVQAAVDELQVGVILYVLGADAKPMNALDAAVGRQFPPLVGFAMAVVDLNFRADAGNGTAVGVDAAAFGVDDLAVVEAPLLGPVHVALAELELRSVLVLGGVDLQAEPVAIRRSGEIEVLVAIGPAGAVAV